MAAKMLDFRSPKRTRTESAAQPMAEPMATISANKDVKLGFVSSKLSDKRTGARFATEMGCATGQDLHNTRLLA
jgi:hypothetical protein